MKKNIPIRIILVAVILNVILNSSCVNRNTVVKREMKVGRCDSVELVKVDTVLEFAIKTHANLEKLTN